MSYDEARGWLKEHAPDWRIASSTSTLRPGLAFGDPTTMHYEVTLVPADGSGSVYLIGEGATLLDATQHAFGALRDG